MLTGVTDTQEVFQELVKGIDMNKFPKSLPNRLHEIVEHWDDERDIGNSIIVTLKAGFEFGIDHFESRHVEGFDNVKDAVQGVKNFVPCYCDDCKKDLAS